MPAHSARLLNLAAVALAACAFGGISVLGKLAYEAGSTPVSLLATRLIVSAVVLCPIGAVAALSRHKSAGWRPLLCGAAGGATFAAAGYLEFEGLARLAAPALVVLLFLAPVWVAIGSRLLWGRRLGFRSAACLAVVLPGIALLVASPGANRLDSTGVALAILASILYAAMFMLTEALVSEVGPFIAMGLIAAAAAVAALALDRGGAAAELSDPATASYAVSIGVLTAGSVLLLAEGLRTTPAFTASVITAAEPVAAALLSWVVLGELLTAIQIAGGVVVVVGVVCLSATFIHDPAAQPFGGE